MKRTSFCDRITRLSRIALLFCLLSFVSFGVLAQDGFLIPVQREQGRLSKSAIDFENQLKSNELIVKLDYVKIGSLSKTQKNGRLSFSIPGRRKKVHAMASFVDYVSDDNYKWYGKTHDGLGDVILVCENGKLSAHVSLPKALYEIYPAPDGYHVVETIDLAKVRGSGCAAPEPDEELIRKSMEIHKDAAGRQNTCPTTQPIRALFLITPAARAANANANNVVNLSVSQFNSCIYNSGITSAATIQLAGIQDFTFTETSNPSGDVARLAADATAQTLRNNFQADIVVLLTNGSYGGTRGIVAAIGPVDNQAFGIAQVNHASASKSCAHEIGHLYGAKHQDDSSAPSFARGYIMKNWLGIVKGRTIMVGGISDSQAADRLLNFSNPSVSVGGFATGTSSNNNARRVIETFATVRSFRADPAPPFGLYVTGPYEVTTPGWRTFEAFYSCGTAPYSFKWEYTNDGVLWSTVSATTDIYNHPFYSQGNGPYWFTVRVTGTDGTGATSSATMRTYVGISSSARAAVEEEEFVSEPEEETVSADGNVRVLVYPNPSVNHANVKYTIAKPALVEVEVINNSGNVVKRMKVEEQQIGEHNFDLNVENLPAGLYYCRLKADKSVIVKRIFVSRK